MQAASMRDSNDRHNLNTMNNVELLEYAAGLLDAGQRRDAREYVQQAIRNDARDYDAWWALAQVSSNETERLQAVRNVLRLRPDHPYAAEALAALQDGSQVNRTYNPQGKQHSNAGQVQVPHGAFAPRHADYKDYLPSAILTFLAYWVFWFAGLFLNIYFLRDADKMAGVGIETENVGCLRALLIVNLIPFALGALLLLGLLAGN
jgi:tetratricopeptide (TPR) repeat protein